MRTLMIAALIFTAALAYAQPAPMTFTWDAVTLGDDDSVLAPGHQVFEYAFGCAHNLADYQADEGHGELYVYHVVVQSTVLTLTHTFDVGDYVCGVYAHNVDGWSASSDTASFTVASAPVVPRHPKKPGNFRIGH